MRCQGSLAQALLDIKPPNTKRVFSSSTRLSSHISSLITPNHFHILTMKFASTIITLAALFSVAIAGPSSSPSVQPVRPNSFYDNGSDSLSNVACSDGPNGMLTRGFTTFDSLPTFPFIGGGFTVKNWGSAECGSCWKLTYATTGGIIYATAIDTVFSGFDLSVEAVEALLLGALPDSFSEIDVEAVEVDPTYCGL